MKIEERTQNITNCRMRSSPRLTFMMEMNTFFSFIKPNHLTWNSIDSLDYVVHFIKDDDKIPTNWHFSNKNTTSNKIKGNHMTSVLRNKIDSFFSSSSRDNDTKHELNNCQLNKASSTNETCSHISSFLFIWILKRASNEKPNDGMLLLPILL